MPMQPAQTVNNPAAKQSALKCAGIELATLQSSGYVTLAAFAKSAC
jgi:hypothetical protein